MKTRRLISNISFNTLAYFRYRVNELFENSIIDYAYYIFHFADNDDKSDHIHFCLQPSRAIDTFELNTYFLEFPFYGDCRLPFRPTSNYKFVNSIDDWLLYCKHDPNYLLSKGQSRNFKYEWSDFYSTDSYSLTHDINNIDKLKYGRLSALQDAVRNRCDFSELIQNGTIPIAYRAQYEAQYKALLLKDNRRILSSKRKMGYKPLSREEQLNIEFEGD